MNKIIAAILLVACLCSCTSQPRVVDEFDLFNGRDLEFWQPAVFGGEGDVRIEHQTIVMEAGNPLSGITWKEQAPANDNYEIEFEARKTDGNDFFAGLTFPVGEEPVSLILGGWGGTQVGLSSIDGNDASDNETSLVRLFEMNRWYRVRVRVTARRIQCWLDGERIIDFDATGRKLSIRPEVDLSQPLGLFAFATEAGYRNLRFRKLQP